MCSGKPSRLAAMAGAEIVYIGSLIASDSSCSEYLVIFHKKRKANQ